MNMKTKRILKPQRYLHELKSGENFYVAAKLEEEDYARLAAYGLGLGKPSSIPIPVRAATKYNANGSWKILKHLPKESRSFERAYHCVDWHGEDHYGTCWIHRMCFPREYILPTELAFVIEDGVLYSPKFQNSESCYALIKSAMNILLEMLGRFELWTVDRTPFVPQAKQMEVPWEILRPGERTKDIRQYLEKTMRNKSKGQKNLIIHRHEHLSHFAPEFSVLGKQNYWGYVVYAFPSKNLYIFESNEVNNATYVFRGDWEHASRLTKTEVLSGHIQEARIYHTEDWYQKTKILITQTGKEVV